jgi:hypothetical protein
MVSDNTDLNHREALFPSLPTQLKVDSLQHQKCLLPSPTQSDCQHKHRRTEPPFVLHDVVPTQDHEMPALPTYEGTVKDKTVQVFSSFEMVDP